MTTEPYSDVVGSPVGDPYSESGAIHEDCPGCGAASGERCTFQAQEYQAGLGVVTVTRMRRHPCIVRITRRTPR